MRYTGILVALLLNSLLPLIGEQGSSHGQTLIRGVVVGRNSRLPISGATVSSPASPSRTKTDSLGTFTFSLLATSADIVVECDGYRPARRPVHMSDSLLVILLQALSFDLDEVLVSTTRLPQTVLSSPSAVSVINRIDIEQSYGGSVADVLASETALFVKDYGAPSALKTISQRGLGMEHTLLLLNGAPMNSLQNGIQDLGTFTLGDIERIEVVQGGQSASFGGNAVAGVINLISREGGDIHRVGGSTSFGSFGERRIQVEASLPTAIGSIRASMHDEQSTGDYPFPWESDTGPIRLLRGNSDLSSRGASLSLSGLWFSGIRASFLGSFQKSERGVAGPVVASISVPRARQTDENGFVQGSALSLIGSDMRLSFKFHYDHAYQRYTDPGLVIAFRSLDNYYVVRRLWVEQTTNVNISEAVSVLAGVDGTLAWAESNALSGDPHQSQWGTFAIGSFYLAGSQSSEGSLLVSPAVRFDVVGSGTPTFSPQLGLLWSPEGFPVGALGLVRPRIRGSVSRNFRSPTFNELYFAGGGGVGNPDLVPERSSSLELGGGLSFNGLGEHHVDLSYFRIDMENRIIWTGGPGGTVRPKNLREVRSQGFEVHYRGTLPGLGLSLTTEYSRSVSEKRSADYPGDPTVGTQLIYAPREKLIATAGYHADVAFGVLRRISLTLSHRRVGFRYVSEDNTQFLPSYATTSIATRADIYAFQVQLFARLEIDNLFNSPYQVFLGYPMPLRSYRLTLGATY